MFAARLRKQKLYAQERIHIHGTGIEFDALWVPYAQIVAEQTPLYPPYAYGDLMK